MTTVLPITLVATGAAALINMWLSIRIGRLRISEKVSVGDGGNPRILARMRAQANFIEYAPITLILIAALELACDSPVWLAVVAGLFLFSRILHGIGMDGPMAARQWGIAGTMLAMLGLGVAAIVRAFVAF